MKKTISLLTGAVIVLAACNSGGANEKKTENTDSTMLSSKADIKEEAWVPVDSATEVKAWTEYATPGDIHKQLAKSDGSWTGETTVWMGIGAPPITSKSSMVNRMIMGGRYQQSEMKGDFMGMPFEGMSITAYDNYKKKFISTWIDNMGTGLMKMEGVWDEATKSVKSDGTMLNPANGKECKMRQVYTFVDDNTELMEMYGPDSKTGKEFKSMEIKFTRKK